MNPNDQPTGLLAILRAAVVSRLAAASDFKEPNAVPVLDGGKSDVLTAVRAALTKRSAGLALLVTIPALEPGDLSPQQINATISVQIYERPLTNWSAKGKNLAIEDAGELVFQSLGFSDDGSPGWLPAETWARLKFGGFRLVFSGDDQVVMEALFSTSTIVQVSASVA